MGYTSVKMSVLLTLVLLPLLLDSAPHFPQELKVNERPIIGIITQEVTDKEFFHFGKTYIAASYVKFLESAGCRVVPIRLNLPEEEYLKLFNSINGVLFPGGASDLLNSSFAQTAGIFYNLAIEAFNSGCYFPVWGTCLGFQLLTALTTGQNLLSHTDANNISLPLDLTKEVSSSRMFQEAPLEILQSLSSEKVTANFHHYGLTSKVFQENKKLSNFYRVMSTNRDRNGVEFISTMEAHNFPIYGVQWHPEVNRFQWNKDLAYPHSVSAIRVSQYLADFFINEARKNQNHFSSAEAEEASLIYNWTPQYTANISGYEQLYFF
ncbi:gamma-glutamyl hydrolase-like isoform 2-T4 [Discoglossus pictus]